VTGGITSGNHHLLVTKFNAGSLARGLQAWVNFRLGENFQIEAAPQLNFPEAEKHQTYLEIPVRHAFSIMPPQMPVYRPCFQRCVLL